MKRGFVLLFFLFLVLISVVDVFGASAQIQLDGNYVNSIATSVRVREGYNPAKNYYFSGRTGGGAIPPNDDIATLDRICFESNFSAQPVVSGKRMTSGSYVSKDPGAELNAYFTPTYDEAVLSWGGSSWSVWYVNSVVWNALKLNPATENITCDVTYEEWCTPETCVSLGVQCGTPDDGCGTPLPSCGTCQAINGTNPCNASTYLCEPVCDAGWDSCDGNEVNGCETELGTDSDCSACGDVCGGTTSCVSGSCLDPTFNYWANMNGNYISFADVGDFVRFMSNVPGSYDVFEGQDDSSVLHTVNETYWQTASVLDSYNFSSSSGFSDGLLVVSSEGTDDDFTLEIMSPPCSDYFDVDTSKVIEINASDPDDLITGNISINGAWVMDFNNSNGGLINYTHIFNEVGNTRVVVLASNSDGKMQKMISNVMVYDSSNSSTQFYVSSCIDSPRNFERFASYNVTFVAASSIGLKYNGTANEIPKELLNFSWTFLLSDDEWGAPCTALGNSHCAIDTNETVWNFTRKFPTVNDNEVFLTVSIPDNVVLNF